MHEASMSKYISFPVHMAGLICRTYQYAYYQRAYCTWRRRWYKHIGTYESANSTGCYVHLHSLSPSMRQVQ